MKINLKILMFFLIVFGFTARVFSISYAKEITLIYTGETHGMIYPCGCPIEPDGGISRRATLIKQLKKKFPGSLLLSTGGFFAGGLLDQYSQDIELDKQRTLVNLKALELMKYDAVAVGDDEFNFGKSFLLDNILKSGINFISANIKTQNITPYVLKEVSGLKVGVIALTTLEAKQKAQGLEILEPQEALSSAVKELKTKGANIIVLLSHMGEEEDIKLVKDVKGVDVVITGHSFTYKGKLPAKIGGVLFLRPAWEGRRLDKAVLTVQNNKITDYKVDDMRLSNKIADDPDILKILPRCFSDKNCKKEGSVGICQNAGNINASCVFSKANKINLTVITSKPCLVCATENLNNYFKRLFPGLVTTYLYYPSDSKAKDLIKKFNITALPVYFLEKSVENDKNFDPIKELVELKDNYYLVKAHLAGVGYFINRNETKGTLDVFLSLFDKGTLDLLNVIKDFNPKIHLLALYTKDAFEAFKGNPEVEEDLRAACVQRYYPEKFWDYITCRSKNIDSSWWDNCLTAADINKIKICACGPEGQALLKENIKLNKELYLMTGPAYLMDNEYIFATRGTPSKEELKKILKR